MTNETRIERIEQIAKEVARLHERLGVIRAALLAARAAAVCKYY